MFLEGQQFGESFMRSFVSWIRVHIHWVWGLSNPSLRFLDHCLHYHSIFGDMIFLSCTNMSWSSFSTSSRFSHLFPIISFHVGYSIFIYFIETHIWFTSLSISIAYCIDDLTISLLSYISSMTLPLFAIEFIVSQDYSAHYILYTRVLGLIIGYLSLVSLNFFNPITLSLHCGPCRKTTLRPWD